MKMFDVEGGVCKMVLAMEKKVNMVWMRCGFFVNKIRDPLEAVDR